MDESSPAKNDGQSYPMDGGYMFTPPVSKRSLRSQFLSARFVTPNGYRRSNFCKSQVYPRDYDQQMQDYVATPKCANKSSKLSSLPLHRTPPSKSCNGVIKNPFEESIRMNLDQPFVTPSLFTNVLSPSKETQQHFSWNIDDLATLRPAWIDEFQNQVDDFVDPDVDQQDQEKIDRFFMSVSNLESPWTSGEAVSRIAIDFREAASTPIRSPKVINMSFEEESSVPPVMVDAWTQTELSLPPIMPMALDCTIEQYCNSFMEVEEQRIFSPQWRQARSALLEEPMESSHLHQSMFSSTVNNPSCSYLTPVLKLSRTSGTPLRLCSNIISPIGVSPIPKIVYKSRHHESPSYWHSYSDEIPADSGAQTWSQTSLSLLRTVPSHIETALKPYHTFTQDQSDDASSLNSSFIRRRKLFHEDDNMNMSVSSIPSTDKGYISS